MKQHQKFILSAKLLLCLMLLQSISFAQCGSCTNPSGNVSVGSGQSVCYDANTTVTSFTIFFDGVVRVCDSITVIVTAGSGFSGTARIELGNCSKIVFQGAFNGSVSDGVVYVGDGSCDAQFTIEASSTLGASLTADSEIRFCNLNSSPVTGSSGAATISCVAPLPIELIRFNAYQQKKKVLLQWSTASEINNNYFTIEKSYNGLTFEEVAQINGAGNSNKIIDYVYYDETSLHEISYYQLKQTDFDGKYTYSKIITTKNNVDSEVTIFIGANKNIILVPTIRDEAVLAVVAVNLNGQLSNLTPVALNTFSTKELNAGLYLLKIRLENETFVRKIFIQ